MEKSKPKNISTLSKVISSTLVTAIIIFTLMLLLVTNAIFNRGIEHSKDRDTDHAKQITVSIENNFDYMLRFLKLAQQSFAELDFSSDITTNTVNIAAERILMTLLDLNPDMHRAWFILKKGVRFEDRYYAREYIRKSGMFVIEDEQTLEDPEIAPWYFKPLTTGETYFDTININDYGTGGGSVYTAIISIPVFVDDKIIGVCGVGMLYEDMFNLRYDFRERQDSILLLLRKDMKIIHAYDHALINKSLADFSFENVDNIRSAMEEERIYSDEIMSPFLGERVFLYIQPILITVESEQQTLFLQISTPLRTLKAEAHDIAFLIVVSISVCMLLFIGIIFFNVNRVLLPIRALTIKAHKIATGDLKVDIFNPQDEDRNVKSEIDILRNAFNKMLRTLHENLHTVEKRVHERTQELIKLNNYIKLLIENETNMFILFDRDMNFVYCSSNVLEFLGLNDHSDIIGKPLSSAYVIYPDPDYAKRSSLRFSRIISGEDLIVVDDFINWPDKGGIHSFHITYRRMLNEDGNFDGIVLTLLDMTEVRLEEAKRHINDMLYSTIMPCLVWDENGRIVAYNKEAAHTFGMPEDLSPEDFNNLYFSFQPEYQPDRRKTESVRQELIREASKKGFAHIIGWLEKIDGTPISVSVTVARIAWISGYRLTVYIHDMTELMVKEAEAKEAEEHVRLMLDSNPMICIMRDENYDILDCNQAALDIFGFSEKADLFRNFNLLYPEFQPDGSNSLDKLNEMIQRFFNDPSDLYQYEWLYKTAKGEPLPVETTFVRIKWNDGIRILLYSRDLREYKRMMAETAEANERIKLMLDATPLCCHFIDEKFNIIDCNMEALNLFGVPDKRAYFENFYKLSPERQPDGALSEVKAMERIKETFEKGRTFFEWIHQRTDGELIPTEVTLVRVKHGDVYIVLGYMRDLREIKANEQKMQEIAEREREALLQKKAAQAASEAKSQFLANMSHEIRTPMNAVLGMSELLLQEKLNKRQRRYIKDIKTSAAVLLDIINDILDISKIQAGKLSLVPVHYDFNIMIDDIASMIQFLLEESDITFKLLMEGTVPRCLYGDDVRLRQVLLNLLGNAVKFTKAGCVSLTVNVTDTNIHFSVSDTGIGIRPENAERLFDIFEQVDELKNRDKKGTGLGLSISKALVEMMGGQITFESVYGHGSTFHVEIPKILGDETLIQHADESEIVICAPDAKILVVDDNRINLNVAYGLLELSQITADTVTSGQQAIELIKQNQYDIVFMDHMMPEMDGIEATKIIRELDINVPIIALTANAVAGMKEMMLAAGMNDYLSKPIIKSQLMNILKNWIPAEKLTVLPPKTVALNEFEDEDHKEFWIRIEQIEEVSLSTGLFRVSGQRDVYKKILKQMINEIEKCDKNLKEFLAADDMHNFRIEVHSMKGSLANIGAMELATMARELEIASSQEDSAFCALNLPPLLEELSGLSLNLKNAFSVINQSDGSIEIPPELQPIFEKLTYAFGDMDIVTIAGEMERLAMFNLTGALKEEIEQIKDAVLIMDYDKAAEIIQRLMSTA